MTTIGPRPIRRILVANRGEIARRVVHTCRRLGIETVAVYSDADAGLPFVAEADAAVALPGNTPAETYLRGDLVVAAALESGADAVHPGYGFLSESADFARRVIGAGLTWVGPSPESIEQMGSKIAAKKLVAEAGVPVLGDLSPESVTEADMPLLVKASAGGGGRGMRVVRTLGEVGAAVEQASNEAASAFGDSAVFCEPYVEHGRHVEVQVVVDVEGNACVLGARDCSVQRRHQKVIEETPAPGLSHETRREMYRTASLVAASARYVGAGTVEFLYDPATERFWFLEMNTRLQVEHPVTEAVHGVDLVEQQIAVAEGRPLRFVCADAGVSGGVTADESGRGQGHAVEVRLYAEDPAADWQPQSGRLSRFEFPGVVAEFGSPPTYGIRVDAGFGPGDEVGTHYDAMLAKVIAWAPTREQALRQLAGALSRARIHGVRTNRDLLVNVLRHEAFVAGEVGTDFLDRHDLATLAAPRADERAVRLSASAAALALAERDTSARTVQRRVPVGWRNVASQPQSTTFTAGGTELRVEWYGGRTGTRLADEQVQVVEATEKKVILRDLSGAHTAPAGQDPDKSGVRRVFDVFADGDRVDVESSLGHVALTRLPRFVDPAALVATGSLLAPMPGTVVGVLMAEGDSVVAGQPVLVLEAMKMQHTVSAPHDGVLIHLPVTVGDQVGAGSVLAVVQASEDEGETA